MEDEYNISQNEFELIERFLNGELGQESQNQLNERISTDSEFKTKVETIRLIINGIETQSLKDQLNVFHQEINDKTSVSEKKDKQSRFQWQALAIAALFVIAAGSYFWLGDSATDKLYDDYFSPDPGLPTTMSSIHNYEFFKAMVSYKQGNYEDALMAWQNQLKTNTSNDTLNYFVGSALLANKQASEAIPYFDSVVNIENTAFKNDAYFYLGLALLKDNQIERAKRVLRKSKLKTATELLNELE